MIPVSETSGSLTLTFLGTGTSQGVPVIGCECDTCLSHNRKDKRLRTSVLVEAAGINILIDAGPDLRQQMLAHRVKHLSAILLTHEHNDHTIGLDDIRPFNFMQGTDIPVYTLPRVISEIKAKFSYVFTDKPYPGSPRMTCCPVEGGQPFAISQDVWITPLHIMHGSLPILGYRIGSIAYITDASAVPADTLAALTGVDTLILNCLRYRPHHSHMNFDEAVALALKVGARQTFLTHMSHEMGLFEDIAEKLPATVFPAYDGLVISV